VTLRVDAPPEVLAELPGNGVRERGSGALRTAVALLGLIDRPEAGELRALLSTVEPGQRLPARDVQRVAAILALLPDVLEAADVVDANWDVNPDASPLVAASTLAPFAENWTGDDGEKRWSLMGSLSQVFGVEKLVRAAAERGLDLVFE
jgi:hypothetical protein